MLTGNALLEKVRSLHGASKSELVRATGYVKIKDGKERLLFARFNDACLAAAGVDIKGRSGSGGRTLTHTARVQFNGNLLVGKAYTASLGLERGDAFRLFIGKNRIVLIPQDPEVTFDGGEEQAIYEYRLTQLELPVGLSTEESESQDEETPEVLAAPSEACGLVAV